MDQKVYYNKQTLVFMAKYHKTVTQLLRSCYNWMFK